MKLTVNPPVSAVHGTYSKTFQCFAVLISKGNEKRTEINLFTERIVQNVIKIILFVFFPTINSKYVYQLSEKALFLSFSFTF